MYLGGCRSVIPKGASWRSSPYFAGLSSGELDSFSELVFTKTAEKGQILAWEGEPVEALYFVASGAVKYFNASSEGRSRSFA